MARLDAMHGRLRRTTLRFALSLAALLTGPPASAQIHFGPQRVINTLPDTNGPEAVFTADLDGDGDLDVLAASSLDNKIVWYENIGGAFGLQQIIATDAASPRAIVAADLDHDGDPDVLAASFGDDTIAWYENTGGAFGPRQRIATDADGAMAVLAADLDGDGDPDVLVASSRNTTFSWYENTDGAGRFGPRQLISSTTGTTQTIAAADLDDDGDLDVLAAAGWNDPFRWFENTDGLGTSWTERTIIDDARWPRQIHAVDLDGDDDLDILAASSLDRSDSVWDITLEWYEHTDGLGLFDDPKALPAPPGFIQPVIAVAYPADLDGDGDLDVLLPYHGALAWFENTDGQGAFGPPQGIVPDALPLKTIHAADLNGDGDLDILTVSFSEDRIAWYENTDGLGTFGPQHLLNIPSDAPGVRALVTADFDGDDDPDVLAASWDDILMASYKNLNGQNTFGPRQTVRNAIRKIGSLDAEDFDGDGDLDALAASQVSPHIFWFENTDGLGTFERRHRVATTSGHIAYDVSAADFDDDGDPDVLAAYAFNGVIGWLENTDGNGNFGDLHVISSETRGPHNAVAADLDGDGDLDVLAAADAYEEDTVGWYENTDGLGTFGPQRIISDELKNARRVVAADLDGDGDLDVLAASKAQEIVWYANIDGLGTFGARQDITTETGQTTSLRAADLDRDGDLDVLATSLDDEIVIWYENADGAGRFGPRQIITTETQTPVAVVATDLDGDDDLDVLVASFTDDMIAWYENTVTSTAATPAAALPQGFFLSAAYPNPFNPQATFTLTLARPQHVSVAVFDLLGRRVARLHEGVLPAGEAHRFVFEAGSLPSGVYVYRVMTEDVAAGRRVVLMR